MRAGMCVITKWVELEAPSVGRDAGRDLVLFLDKRLGRWQVLMIVEFESVLEEVSSVQVGCTFYVRSELPRVP